MVYFVIINHKRDKAPELFDKCLANELVGQ